MVKKETVSITKSTRTKRSKVPDMPKKQFLVSTSTLIIISLLVGVLIGFSIGSTDSTPEVNSHNSEHNTDYQDPSHDHSTHTHDDIHSHEQLEILQENVPIIEIQVLEDSKSGYNLEIDTTNFEFISTVNYEEHSVSDSEHTSHLKGHAHLYINGEKITRLYSNSYYLGELEGHNEITVTLNSNSHEDYTFNGEVIKATKILMVE